MTDTVQVTARDAVHAGIVLGLTQTRTLDVWRELGGKMRDVEWAELWVEEVRAFKVWRSLNI